MRNVAQLLFFLLVAYPCAFLGQRLSKDTADLLFIKSLESVKANDTASFIGLWSLDYSGSKYPVPHTEKDLKNDFADLRKYLKPVLSSTLSPDRIELIKTKRTARNYYTEYMVKGIFMVGRKNYLGYGVCLDYIDQQWKFRYRTWRYTRQSS